MSIILHAFVKLVFDSSNGNFLLHCTAGNGRIPSLGIFTRKSKE